MDVSYPMILTSEWNVNKNKCIRVGLCNANVVIAFHEKKNILYMDRSEWDTVSNLIPRMFEYFKRRKGSTKEADVEFQCKNIMTYLTYRGRNRVIRFENTYPWVITLNPSLHHMTLISPNIHFTKGDISRLDILVAKINDSIQLLDKILEVYTNHTYPREDFTVLDVNIDTNTLFIIL